MNTILEKPDFKTIRVTAKTYEKLIAEGKYSDSMDEIINRILNRISNMES
ncbi:MAG: DUF7557 family protein [Nitrososphaeraceae archaeon]